MKQFLFQFLDAKFPNALDLQGRSTIFWLSGGFSNLSRSSWSLISLLPFFSTKSSNMAKAMTDSALKTLIPVMVCSLFCLVLPTLIGRDYGRTTTLLITPALLTSIWVRGLINRSIWFLLISAFPSYVAVLLLMPFSGPCTIEELIKTLIGSGSSQLPLPFRQEGLKKTTLQ